MITCSSHARNIALFITRDDGLTVCVNDEVSFDLDTWRHSWRDRFFCTVKLKKGWNRVPIKCVNHLGGWGFALRPPLPALTYCGRI